MSLSILEAFDSLATDIKVDKKLLQRFIGFQLNFVNKNSEHMDFFGGNLLGVQVVRFTPADFNRFFDEVVMLDPDVIDNKMDEVKAINKEFKVSSDVMNLTLFYFMHRFLISPLLTNEQKVLGAKNAALIFFYRVMTSLLSNYFRYPADPKVAEATYLRLSNKYLIKKLGNWQEVFNYRANELIKTDAAHYRDLLTFKDDYAIIAYINDAQGRIRDMVKNIYAEFKQAHVSGEKVETTSLNSTDVDGDEVIRDKVHGEEIYENYILSILHDKHSFIKEELISIVVNTVQGLSPKAFRKVLEWMSENSHSSRKEEIERFIHCVLVYTIEYLLDNNISLRQNKDISELLVKIKNLYLSSRSSDEALANIREYGHKLVKDAAYLTSDQSIATTRTAIILYICLRTFTKSHYHGH